MNSVKDEVKDFLDKCEEMRSCKFIMATTKIRDLLKSIVNSSELYELFNTVVSKFDYSAAKRRCLLDGNNGVYSSSYVVLPDTMGERLAFIFCLLAEFDRDEVNFNAFLRRYYMRDGSYYSSYHAFCDEIIVSLEDIIREVYSEELGKKGPSYSADFGSDDSVNSEQSGSIALRVDRKKDFSSRSSLRSEDRIAADKILTCLAAAVRTGDKELVEALAFGYNYFTALFNPDGREEDALFDAIGNFVE